jgi:hypothetical protein
MCPFSRFPVRINQQDYPAVIFSYDSMSSLKVPDCQYWIKRFNFVNMIQNVFSKNMGNWQYDQQEDLTSLHPFGRHLLFPNQSDQLFFPAAL